jgi:hypothetical protein
VGNPKRLLILNRAQFGYHLQMYYYCQWAQADFQITYHGFDTGQPKLDADGVEVHYIPRSRGLVRRYLRFLGSCLAECGRNYDVIFVKYFPGCSLLRLLHPWHRFVLDIRTGSVASHPWKRRWQDSLLRLESLRFRHITVISASLARKLGLVRAHLLPLGADPVETPAKDFSALHLLYVGTFHGRRLEGTITGFHRFYREMRHAVKMTYDVVGDGPHGERDRPADLGEGPRSRGGRLVAGLRSSSATGAYYEMQFRGFLRPHQPHLRLPATHQDLQIPSGRTAGHRDQHLENAAVITEHNGLLIDDTPEAFYGGLKKLAQTRVAYSSNGMTRRRIFLGGHRTLQPGPCLDSLITHGEDTA